MKHKQTAWEDFILKIDLSLITEEEADILFELEKAVESRLRKDYGREEARTRFYEVFLIPEEAARFSGD